MTVAVHLHGSLARQYGGPFHLDIASPIEAVRALGSQLPGFLAHILQGEWRVTRNDEPLDEGEVTMSLGMAREVHLVPVPAGSKNQGLGKIILGVALIGLAAVGAGAFSAAGANWGASVGFLGLEFGTVALLGASIALSGVALMLSPVPGVGDYGAREERNPSFLFNGVVNRTEQGGPVPVAYGRTMAGSVVVSSGITSERQPTGTGPLESWAIDLNGITDYVDLGVAPSININAPITVEAWVVPRTLAADTTGNPIISNGEAGVGGWELRVESSGSVINLVRHGATQQNQRVTITPALVAGEPYHLRVVQSRKVVEVWVNNVSKGTFNATSDIITSYTGNAYIGRRGTRYWDGILDDVRVWDRRKQADWTKEVVIQTGLVGYWKFNEGSGATTADETGAANGTLQGSAKFVVPPVRPELPNNQFRDKYWLQPRDDR